MQITPAPSTLRKAKADWFTGDVYIDAVVAPAGSSTFAAAFVHFTPRARTAWHTHPHGQTIFVTEGIGLCQREGGPVEVIPPMTVSSSSRTRTTATAPHQRLYGPRGHAPERRDRQPLHVGRARHRRAVLRGAADRRLGATGSSR